MGRTSASGRDVSQDHFLEALPADHRLHWYVLERVLGQGGFEGLAGNSKWLVAAALGAGALGGLVVGAAAGATTSGAVVFALGCAAALGAVALAGALLRDALRPARSPGAARAQATSRSGTGTGASGPT